MHEIKKEVAALSGKQDMIVVLDFGSQYTQIIGRRLRELNVYSKIYPYTTSAQQLRELGIKGLIFSGGPASVLAEGSPRPDPAPLV